MITYTTNVEFFCISLLVLQHETFAQYYNASVGWVCLEFSSDGTLKFGSIALTCRGRFLRWGSKIQFFTADLVLNSQVICASELIFLSFDVFSRLSLSKSVRNDDTSDIFYTYIFAHI